MESAMLRSLVTTESASASIPSAPAKAVSRTYPCVPQQGDSIELQRIHQPAASGDAARHALNLDPDPDPDRDRDPDPDLERSRPPSPAHEPDGVEVLPSMWQPYKNRYRLLSGCMVSFGNGINDSAAGALIPYIEQSYHIGYAVVSLIFVGNALGFIVAALFLDTLRERLGRAKMLFLAQLLIATGYLPVLVSNAPFVLIVAGFFVIGFGMSVNIALANIFCGRLRTATVALGAVHGCYSVGGTVGPLIATAIVAVAGAVWNRYYLICFGMALVNAVFAAWAYWDYEDELSEPLPPPPPSSSPTAASDPRRTNRRLVDVLATAFTSRVILLGAVFIFAYQGAEVSISGWVISFLVAARQGDLSSVGYVTSGFWAGITLGRFCLSGVAAHPRVGEKRFVYAIVCGAAVFELLVWLVPNIVGDAISVAVVGLLLGPVYPCAAAVFLRGMSRGEQASGLGVISAFGSSGGAVAPFTTGLLAQAVGTFVLHPICLGLFAAMLVCWFWVPNVPKRTE